MSDQLLEKINSKIYNIGPGWDTSFVASPHEWIRLAKLAEIGKRAIVYVEIKSTDPQLAGEAYRDLTEAIMALTRIPESGR